MLTNEDFREMEFTALLDLLSRETQQYTNAMHFSVSDPNLKEYEKKMKLIMDEIEYRKRKENIPSDNDVQLTVRKVNGNTVE